MQKGQKRVPRLKLKPVVKGLPFLGTVGIGEVEKYKVEPVPTTANADPWANRSAGMKCKTCMWFVPKIKDGTRDGVSYDLGRCRKHAPTMTGYPAVWVNDFCGDMKIDENKI